MVIHITLWPLLTLILPTLHIMTLTYLVYRIGLIWISTYRSLNTMNKTGIIITTLHRVNGDTTPPSHIVNHYFNILPIIFLVMINNRRKIWGYKKNGSHDWVLRAKAKIDGLIISRRLPNPYSTFQVTQQEEPMDSDRSMKNLIQS